MYSVVKIHKEFLLISKDPGVDFHKGSKSIGLVEVVKSDLGIKELYTLHRLDRITSGLLLFARNRDVARDLAGQFQKKLVGKYYLALSDHRPKKKQGVIKGDMERSRRGGWKLSRSMRNPAITQFFSYPLGDGSRLFIMKPHTGKTHQLRVAMKSISSPVLGDPVYHRNEGDKSDRAYLHSYGMIFFMKGRNYQFVNLPDQGVHFRSERFLHLMKSYEKPWELRWPSV
jgi:tRNA pseudouridine32 synthase/23S rRNA pseudouridine746 synthase